MSPTPHLPDSRPTDATPQPSADAGLVEQLRQDVRLRDEFLAVTTHELRNALTPVASLVDYLQATVSGQPQALPAGIARLIQHLSTATDRYLRRTTLLLEASRFMAGYAYRPLATRFDLSQLVREAVDSAQPSAALVNSHLHTAIEADVEVTMDRLGIELIVDNLISNAVKYGAGKPVQVSLKRDGAGSVCFSVSDEGIGISSEDLANIFNAFERAAPVRGTSGFGVGLWVVQKMADAMNARLAVTSTLGRGSVFSFTLALAHNEGDAP
jgi:signal transduction histidine kinase